MHATALLAPVAGYAFARAMSRSNSMPTPTDAPRQIASGPNADRILVAGGGIAVGYGVHKQELALPGRLAVAVSAMTGRGAMVDVVARSGLPIEEARALLAEVRVEHYDAIVLTLGAGDAYRATPPTRWRRALEQLLDTLDARVGRGTVVHLASVGPLPRPFDTRNLLARAADAHARLLDETTESVVARRTGTALVQTGETGLTIRWNSTFDYDRLGRRLAPVLAERLDDLWSTAPAQSARRLRSSSDPELLRQAALDRTGLVGTDSTPALERLLRLITNRMGVQAAGVTLIDGDSQRTKAAVGVDSLDMARSEALCNQTIRGEVTHVEADLRGHPIEQRGWRFYAGFPLESPDGYRIGAVCLLDPEPRPEGEFDEAELADLATRVQNELWAEIAGHPSPDQQTTLTGPTVLAGVPAPELRSRTTG